LLPNRRDACHDRSVPEDGYDFALMSSAPHCEGKTSLTKAAMTEQPIHPLFRNRPPPEAKLWRYLSFAKFAALLGAGQLHFTRVDHLDDHFEGAWPKQDVATWEQNRAFFVTTLTERSRKSVAVSCWVESKHESAAMWGLYASGREGVAITTSFAKLDQAVSEAATKLSDCVGGAGRVTYVDHFTENLLALGPQNALMPFMLKNRSYEHEHEVRALVNGEWALGSRVRRKRSRLSDPSSQLHRRDLPSAM
jgi:hypothetical protein